MERIDDLNFNGLKIIQSNEVFSFSIDAVLLAHFGYVPKKGKIIDLCAGNGAVGLLCTEKTKASIDFVELQPRLAEMAERSIALNKKSAQCHVHCADLKELSQYFTHDTIDAILCNPPYFPVREQQLQNPNPHLAIARHEIYAEIEDIMQQASYVLKTKGHLSLVHRPDRFLPILEAMQNHQIAPKKVRFIYSKMDRPAKAMIIEGIKNGSKEGFIVEPPFIIQNENNEYTKEMMDIFHGK